MKESDKEYNELKEACLPLIKYMAENFHPHMELIITATSFKLVEGQMAGETFDFIIQD